MKLGLLRSKSRKIALVTVLTLLALSLFYGWFTKGTPVDRERAVEIFREAQAEADEQRRAAEGSSATDETPSRTTTTEPGVPGGRKAPGALKKDGALVYPLAFRPRAGTYAYDTDGEERVEPEVFSRDLSGITHRNVVHTGDDTWYDHHIFREERESWAYYRQDDRGRTLVDSRNRIAFGGGRNGPGIDERIPFEPPARTAVVPWKLGRRWTGTFSGEVHGSFQSRTVEHGFIDVGGTQVEVWADKINLEMHGRVEGTVVAKRWISPRYGIVVREEYVANATKGPFTYIAEWSVQLRSLRPSL